MEVNAGIIGDLLVPAVGQRVVLHRNPVVGHAGIAMKTNVPP